MTAKQDIGEVLAFYVLNAIRVGGSAGHGASFEERVSSAPRIVRRVLGGHDPETVQLICLSLRSTTMWAKSKSNWDEFTARYTAFFGRRWLPAAGTKLIFRWNFFATL